MSPVGWEHQALDSIQSALGHTDPKLASLSRSPLRATG